MNENVVALPGYSVPTREAVQEVVDILEEALAKAKDGKLDGVAVVMAERDPAAFDVVYHASGTRHSLAAGVMALHWKIAQRMAE